MNAKTHKMYEMVREAQLEGQHNLLLVDMCNPRVNAGDNVFERADRVFTYLKYTDWTVLVVTGQGVSKVTFDAGRTAVQKGVILGDVIQDVRDRTPTKPICVMGFHVINRSVSVRADNIVPTHIIMATPSSTSMDTLIQRFGRAQGMTKEHLGPNGGKVYVLCTESDWEIASNYHPFMEELFARCCDNKVVDDIESIFEQHFPSRFRTLMDVSQPMGNRKLSAKEHISSIATFDKEPHKRCKSS